MEEVPGTYTTATSYYDQATPSTTTIAAWTGGSAPGTVLVLEVCIRDKVESEQSSYIVIATTLHDTNVLLRRFRDIDLDSGHFRWRYHPWDGARATSKC